MSVFDNNNDNQSEIRTASGRKPKTFEQWQNVRRSNPSAYYSGQTIRKVNEDREALGHSAFYKRTTTEDEE